MGGEIEMKKIGDLYMHIETGKLATYIGNGVYSVSKNVHNKDKDGITSFFEDSFNVCGHEKFRPFVKDEDFGGVKNKYELDTESDIEKVATMYCNEYGLNRDDFEIIEIGRNKYLYDKKCEDLKVLSNHDNSGDILPEPTKTEPATDFVIDMVHNIEELAELQKELTKWVRGKLRKDKLLEEIQDAKIAIENIEKWIDKL